MTRPKLLSDHEVRGRLHDMHTDKPHRDGSDTETERPLQQATHEQRKYEVAFSSSLSALCILRGREHRYEAVNVVYQEQVFPGIDLIGKTVREVVPDVYEQGFGALLDAVYETGMPQCGREMLLRLPERDDRYFNFVYAPMHDEQGAVNGIYVEAQDVTEQVLTRHALEESEHRHRLISEHSTDMISTHTPDGAYIYVSPACRSLLGYEPSELVGRSAYEFFHPDDCERIKETHSAVLEGPDVSTVSYRIRRKDGRYIWFETTSRTIRDPRTSAVDEIIAVSRDISEWKEAEAALQASELRFRAIFEGTAAGILLANMDGRPVKVNAAFEEMLGYSEEELRRMHFAEFTHPDDIEADTELATELVAGRRDHYEIEKRYIRKDGRSVWTCLTVSLIRDTEGEPQFAVAMAQDITERKQAEEELRTRALQQEVVSRLGQLALASRDLSSLMAEAGALVTRTMDVEYFQVLELLPDSQQMLLRAGVGWQQGEAGQIKVGTEIDSLAGYTLASSELVVVSDLRAESRFSVCALLYEHRVVSSVSIRIPGQGRPFGVLGVHTPRERTFTADDVHFLQAIANVLAQAVEREALERQLAEDRFRLLVQNSSDVITITGADGTIQYQSPSVERVLGYGPEELTGTNGLDLAHPDDVPRLRSVYAEAVKVPGATLSTELRFRHRNGTWRHLEIIGSNLLDDPRIGGLVFNWRDITERRELAVTQERGRIAREMHDSLAQVLGYVNTKAQAAQQLLKMRNVELATIEIRQLAEAARSVYADVREDILGLRTSLEPDRCLVDALREYLVSWQEQSQVLVEMIVPEGITLQLSPSAELQLLRVIQEALANVRKHSGARRALVRFSAAAGWVEVLVEDDGMGFDPAAPARGAFPRFGLATMRERAEAVGGSLDIDSAPGQGCRVTVCVPACTTIGDVDMPDAGARANIRVLIADDHALFRDGLRSLLQAQGVDVAGEAHNGQQVIELARVHRPDIVLMDLAMPGLDGLSATRLLSAELPEVKVVVVTASEEDADLFDAIKSGAQGYILKNLEADQFFDLLAEVVRGEPALTPGLARKLLTEFARPESSREERSRPALTDREMEVLELLVQGVTSTRKLAEELMVTEHTVKYHLRNILSKLHLQNRAQVVAYALHHGLVHRPESS